MRVTMINVFAEIKQPFIQYTCKALFYVYFMYRPIICFILIVNQLKIRLSNYYKEQDDEGKFFPKPNHICLGQYFPKATNTIKAARAQDFWTVAFRICILFYHFLSFRDVIFSHPQFTNTDLLQLRLIIKIINFTMITENLAAVSNYNEFQKENQGCQCSINLLFRNVLTKTRKIPVFKSLINLQRKTKSTSQNIGTGKLISKKMRLKLINWMEKLALETFQFSIRTLLLAIKILDEYLCLTNESPSSLQLIGCACLYLAAKTCEVVIVASQCYIVASANSFTQSQLLDKQIEIYRSLNYDTTFTSLSKVYKYMKQNFGSSNLQNYIRKDVDCLFLQIAKNLELMQFGEHKIVSMFFAVAEINKQIPSESSLLELLKQSSSR